MRTYSNENESASCNALTRVDKKLDLYRVAQMLCVIPLCFRIVMCFRAPSSTSTSDLGRGANAGHARRERLQRNGTNHGILVALVQSRGSREWASAAGIFYRDGCWTQNFCAYGALCAGFRRRHAGDRKQNCSLACTCTHHTRARRHSAAHRGGPALRRSTSRRCLLPTSNRHDPKPAIVPDQAAILRGLPDARELRVARFLLSSLPTGDGRLRGTSDLGEFRLVRFEDDLTDMLNRAHSRILCVNA